MFSRYHRMAGDQVLMVSGTDEHGTPIQVQADAEGVTARELADRYNRVIAEDLTGLGMSYDLFTRTTTLNHYAVTQEIFKGLYDNGYIFAKTALGAVSPSTGRTLPDRYIEGTCPICGYDGARGDQCDNCQNQLDPIDLINPRSRINGETPKFVETEQFFLDLPAFADVLGTWLQSKSGQWRPNVLKFSLNLLGVLQPRAITRDLDWGVPIPLVGCVDRADKRIYVWFYAVIGYLSASIEGARRIGAPDAWRAWWLAPDARADYFMGKDNIVFHSEIWPAMLLGYSGKGAKGGQPGSLGALNLPTEIVSSEYLTMEGRKFSSSRSIVIYVRDFLSRYDVDALRYYVAVAGPESQDTDFTWSEFIRRNNDELVANWGNLVNRSVSFAARNIGEIPAPGELTDADQAILEHSRNAFSSTDRRVALRGRGSRSRSPRPCASLSEANKYLSDQAPWKLRESDPERMATIMHVALQLVDDGKTLLTPFLPKSSQKVFEMLGGEGTWSDLPRIEEVTEDGGREYPVITGTYTGQAAWRSAPVKVGAKLETPTPLFAKIDPAAAEDELARLGGYPTRAWPVNARALPWPRCRSRFRRRRSTRTRTWTCSASRSSRCWPAPVRPASPRWSPWAATWSPRAGSPPAPLSTRRSTRRSRSTRTTPRGRPRASLARTARWLRSPNSRRCPGCARSARPAWTTTGTTRPARCSGTGSALTSRSPRPPARH